MKQVRSKLAEARAKKHWTLAKAAKELGVTENTVSSWECGKTRPYAYNQERICEVYGITPEELLGLYDEARMREEELDIAPPQPEATRHLRAFIKQDLTMHLWSLASLPHRTYQEIHSSMARILKDYDKMNSKNQHINRREALLRLITLPLVTPGIAAALTSEETPSATACKEILAQCAVSIAAAWELRKSAEYRDLVLAFEGGSTYLPVLQRIVKDSSEHRQEAAGLATQCLLLKSRLANHVENPVNAISYAQQTLSYSKAAQDISLRLAALESLTLMYSYSKQYLQAWQTIQQAEPLLKQIEQKKIPVSPYVLALTNGMLACTYARNGQDGTANLERACALLPESDNKRPIDCPVYVEYSKEGLLLDTGIVYTHQGKSAKAIEALSQIVDPKTFAAKILPADEKNDPL